MFNALSIHPKVTGATIAAALTTIVIWGLSYWVEVPIDVRASLTIIFTFVGGWLSPASNGASTEASGSDT